MKIMLAIVAMALFVLVKPVVADELVQHGFNLSDQTHDSGWFQKVAGGEPPPTYMGACGAPTPDHQLRFESETSVLAFKGWGRAGAMCLQEPRSS